MAIEIPSEVAFFLNMIGVPYPDINEDHVRALGDHVRTFATDVENTHAAASGAIKDMNSVYSGVSYDALAYSWAAMSASNMADLQTACTVVGNALDVAATVITAVKVAVLAELAALATTFAITMFTPGLAVTGPAVAAVARRLCTGMEEMIIGYIAAEVLERAIAPLEDTIDRMIRGVTSAAAHDLLGIPPPDLNAVKPLHIEPDKVLGYAQQLDDYADDILGHADTFAKNVAALDFTTSVPDFPDPPGSVAPPGHSAHSPGLPAVPPAGPTFDVDSRAPSSLLSSPCELPEDNTWTADSGLTGGGARSAGAGSVISSGYGMNDLDVRPSATGASLAPPLDSPVVQPDSNTRAEPSTAHSPATGSPLEHTRPGPAEVAPAEIPPTTASIAGTGASMEGAAPAARFPVTGSAGQWGGMPSDPMASGAAPTSSPWGRRKESETPATPWRSARSAPARPAPEKRPEPSSSSTNPDTSPAAGSGDTPWSTDAVAARPPLVSARATDKPPVVDGRVAGDAAAKGQV
ncbi:hypothetical protein NN3_23220 [Nocardia neocaledoniensis NBRC 108232]|uniref:Outer membrane channel protein CpnT-like N-terminal domain-containing protein n=1 Tax=Nocardia neocaledoniensis TaxID=236511 RepID=A0A317N0S3_9NOCA|nr:hypothetical protein [Nocardia neocaledoniensis]PWV66948.1 hypothetical protein DFR69_12213 [Nocardia neocaledoniensis]GEM31315.1 hypothetical protein NN3_23220 [Nocardia neocaledoniensis NBRC 108232]